MKKYILTTLLLVLVFTASARNNPLSHRMSGFKAEIKKGVKPGNHYVLFSRLPGKINPLEFAAVICSLTLSSYYEGAKQERLIFYCPDGNRALVVYTLKVAQYMDDQIDLEEVVDSIRYADWDGRITDTNFSSWLPLKDKIGTLIYASLNVRI